MVRLHYYFSTRDKDSWLTFVNTQRVQEGVRVALMFTCINPTTHHMQIYANLSSIFLFSVNNIFHISYLLVAFCVWILKSRIALIAILISPLWTFPSLMNQLLDRVWLKMLWSFGLRRLPLLSPGRISSVSQARLLHLGHLRRLGLSALAVCAASFVAVVYLSEWGK